MSNSIAGKIKINTFSDIVGGDDAGVIEIPINEMHTFNGHPFRVLDDERMQETVESVKAYGILMPGIVRPRKEGGYEIIAGHRRKRACELAGLKTMPVMVKKYTDDEAVVAMVDSNIQREDILPSEKARAYRLKYEAVKHQGKDGGNSYDMIGEAAGECGKTVQRYIALSNLSEPLLILVDKKKLPIRSGVELSFLLKDEQKWIEEILDDTPVVITPAKAEKIKTYSQERELTRALVKEILTEEKPKPVKVVLKADKIFKYFSDEMSSSEIEEKILEILDEWKKKGGN